MRRHLHIVGVAMLVLLAASCAHTSSTADRLRAMRTGVWISKGGAYTVWTSSHYFVVSASGDSTASNIYCGSTQVRYTDRGIARKQNFRLRQAGTGQVALDRDYSMFHESESSTVQEAPLEIDVSLFQPNTCANVNGVIYDSITEDTAEYILLSTCNGDREKLFADGRSVYMPAEGGEHWSYRIEKW